MLPSQLKEQKHQGHAEAEWKRGLWLGIGIKYCVRQLRIIQILLECCCTFPCTWESPRAIVLPNKSQLQRGLCVRCDLWGRVSSQHNSVRISQMGRTNERKKNQAGIYEGEAKMQIVPSFFHLCHCHSGFKKRNQWHFMLNHAAAEIRLMGVQILCEVVYLGLIQQLF